jgi:hypothetical protein
MVRPPVGERLDRAHQQLGQHLDALLARLGVAAIAA